MGRTGRGLIEWVAPKESCSVRGGAWGEDHTVEGGSDEGAGLSGARLSLGRRGQTEW